MATYRGNSGLFLSFKIGAGAATVLGSQVKSWELTNEPKDDSDLTFGESSAGLGVDWTLALTGVVDHAVGSLWDYFWSNPGVDLLVTVGPYGNTTPSASQPHYTFTANTGSKPPFGNEAGGPTSARAEFEQELVSSTDISKVTA